MAGVGSSREVAMLKQQADGLAKSLDEIRRRIEEIQGPRAKSEPVVEQSNG
jgi:hypothetical protein